jgi:hypothetical protein
MDHFNNIPRAIRPNDGSRRDLFINAGRDPLIANWRIS